MEKFKVTGMSCAACSARVEKAVSQVEGVNQCSVNLLTGAMTVEGNASRDAVISAVVDAGYGIAEDLPENKIQKAPEKSETGILALRLCVSLFFVMAIMYIAMGHNMFDFPLPPFLDKNPISNALTQLILSAVVMVINQKFFINGFKGLVKKAPNMDTLVAIGSAASFGYSVFVTYKMSDAVVTKGALAAEHFLHDLYFESAAMILALITLGKMLESYSKGKTTNAIKALMELAPEKATVIRDGKEQVIPASSVVKDDIFIVKPGDKVPVDGVVIEGSTSLDESALTGESMPADKKEGDTLFASSVNLSGFVRARATKVGEDTSLSQIIKMVSDASSTKAPVSKIADKVSGIFVPVVIIIACITLGSWLAVGKDFSFSIARAISVLVISCPCALGLATPVAIMVGSGVGAKNGVLFKTAAALENTGKIKTVVVDKTGTVTKGEPVVTDVEAVEDDLLIIAASLEIKSEHPLAKAVNNYALDLNISPLPTDDFEIIPGGGLCATLDGSKIYGGSFEYISKIADIAVTLSQKAQTLQDEGKTLLWFARDKTVCGFIAVADTVREDSKQAIEKLNSMGIRTVLLTGDNHKTAQAIAKMVGITEVIAGVLPQQKAQTVEKLKTQGKTAMVGDGINDAPALATADIGMAIGAGTDIAIDSADVVLVKNSICDVAAAIKLARATLKNIHVNLFWAFFYNSVGIPLAAGLFIPILGWQLSPMFGAAAMSLSSFCVVTNALFLNFVKLNRIKPRKEQKKMEKVFKVEGMMCPHCENHVKTALEKIPGVEKAEPSHKDGTVKLTFSSPVEDGAVADAIKNAGYKMI